MFRSIVVAAIMLAGSARAFAQQADNEKMKLFQSIDWQSPPGKAQLGDVATIDIPASCRFTGEEGTAKFLELTENPTDGSELGILFCASPTVEGNKWFMVFSYDPSGYVKDDERATLDADKILASLKRGNEAANKERKSRGWEPVNLDGWMRPPYYDSLTHNLTWATKASSPSGSSMNHSVRLLGRGGVMHVDLVGDVEQAELIVPAFDSAVTSYAFESGQTYAEWKPGDKVAEYGLTALIAGGAGAAAVKLGLFGKLWKLILTVVLALKKAVIVAVVAVVAWFKKVFGRKKDTEPQQAT
jgi:uncharacterized membrane-anchored protein